mmetsp:Transcript_788/g.1408  ORF Transcript_788/g.1408 Transcript_788/m.1408 type:complete len:144 (+) Transcript_788:255-686(+)
MLIIQDKASGKIVSQVYNFVDQIGLPANSLNLNEVETFLMARGVLKPDVGFAKAKVGQQATPQDLRLKESYYLCNEGSYLNPRSQEVDQLVQAINSNELSEDFEQKKSEHMDGTNITLVDQTQRGMGFIESSQGTNFAYKATI